MKGVGGIYIRTIIDGIIFSIFLAGFFLKVKVGVLFNMGIISCELPTFIYRTLFGFIFVFICFTSPTMKLIQSLYYLYRMTSWFIQLFYIHLIIQIYHHYHFILFIRTSEHFISHIFQLSSLLIQHNSHLETAPLGPLLEN